MDDTKTITHQQKKLSEKICLTVFLTLYVFVFILRIPRMFFEGTTFIWIQVSMYGLLGISSVLLFRHTFFVGFQRWKTNPVKNMLWLLGAYVGGMIGVQLAALPAYIMGVRAPQNDTNVLLAIQIQDMVKLAEPKTNFWNERR